MEYLCTISNGDDNEHIKLFTCHNHIIMNKYNDITYTKINNIILENNNIESYFNINNNLHYYKEYNVQDYMDIVSAIIERDLEIAKLLPQQPPLKRKLNLPENYHNNPVILCRQRDNEISKQIRIKS